MKLLQKNKNKNKKDTTEGIEGLGLGTDGKQKNKLTTMVTVNGVEFKKQTKHCVICKEHILYTQGQIGEYITHTAPMNRKGRGLANFSRK